MRTVRARLAGDFRRRWRSAFALVLAIGLAGGAVLTASTGARRTDTAYRRFLRSSRAEDVYLASGFDPQAQAVFGQVARLPQVVAAAPVAAMILLGHGLTTPYHFAGVDSRFGTVVGGAKLIAGRTADPASTDEVVVNRAMARQLHLRPGRHVTVEGLSAGEADANPGHPPKGVRVRLKVVGVGVYPSDVVPTAGFDSLPIFYLPAGYYRAHPTLTQEYGFYLFRLKHGDRDVRAFRTSAFRTLKRAGASPEDVLFNNQADRTAKVERAIRPQAVALGGFALLTALASLLVIGQAMSRQISLDAVDHPTLRALGMTSRQLFAVALIRMAVIVVLGAAVAVAVAIVSSPLMPIGPARVAEPHTGVEINLAILAVGFTAIVVLLVLRSVWPAWRAARLRPGVLGAPAIAGAERSSRLATWLAGSGFPAPMVVGTRMALEPGRGRTAVPVRSALLGTAIAVAAVVGAFTFKTNLDRLVTTPHLYGWNWDTDAGIGFFSLPDSVKKDLLADPDTDGVAGAQYSSVTIGRRTVPSVGIDQLGGAPVFPTLLEGRAPSRPDEIALGSTTLRQAHRRVGDTLVVGVQDAPRRMRIVGRVVFPKFGGASFSPTGLGEGAATTAESLGPVDESGSVHSVALIRFKPGVDRPAAVTRVRRIVSDGRFLGCPSALCITNATTQRPGDIENYDRVRGTPLVLAGLLVVMALGALANTLVTSIRRRRRDLAILKTLGFVGRQASATVAWQATTLAAAALLVGLPLGIAAGRLAWTAFAHQLGVAAGARTPTLAVLLALPATVLLANLIAAIPAAAAARTRPAVVLRTE